MLELCLNSAPVSSRLADKLAYMMSTATLLAHLHAHTYLLLVVAKLWCEYNIMVQVLVIPCLPWATCSGCGYDVSQSPCWCTQIQAATLTWLAYYYFTCANMQTSLKSLFAFVHNNVKNAFSQSPQYILCIPTWQTQHGRIWKVNGNTYTELQVVYTRYKVMC